MSVRLSFIIATTGRPTLVRMLDSIYHQSLIEGDQVVIVGNDGGVGVQFAGKDTRQVDWVYYPHTPCNDWGHSERNFGMLAATGTHLVFGDDDDVFTPCAADSIRRAAAASPDRPLMFRMFGESGVILWRMPRIQIGNHGTPQFVAPNAPGRLGRFGHRYEGDFDFVTSTLEKYPDGDRAVVWCGDVIYGCRPRD